MAHRLDLAARLGSTLIVLQMLAIVSSTSGADPAGTRSLLLATTTSTQDSGLLDALLPAFEDDSGIRVKTVAVGSGAALALGARGEADALLVHAPGAERKWMAEGHGDMRLPVMHNEFVVVGPAADPASVRASATVTAALGQIARQRVAWISRDDGSGTDLLEKELWRQSGEPEKPSGEAGWYVRSGQGMGATLLIADARRAYTLSDRGTWLAWRAKVRLVELLRGDPRLRNDYSVISVRADKLPEGRIHAREAVAFARWLTGPHAQRLIAEFGRERYGEPLFAPASAKPAPALPALPVPAR